MSAGTALSPLVDAFLVRHPDDAARVLGRSSPAQIAALLASRPAVHTAKTWIALGSSDAARVLAAFAPAYAHDLLQEVDTAAAARVLAHFDADIRTGFADALDPARAREIRELLTYPTSTAGWAMDARVFALTDDVSVAEALALIRSTKTRSAELPVTDRDGRFRGMVSLHELLAEDGSHPVASLMHTDAVRIHALAPREEVVELLNEHKLRSLPVVDASDVLVGVLRHDALVTAATADAAAKLQQMVGAGAQERALSTPWLAVRSRLPWLQVNLLTAFLASAVVGYFEDTIARVTALAVLLPVAAGQSGNTGAQALAVTMRGLALREIRVSHVWRVLRKEAAAGLINGVIVGLSSGLGVYVWSQSLALALLMAVAMVCSMIVASMAGAAIPAILTKLGRDPATAASILLTTVTDIVGFMTFLGLAALFADLLVGS